MFHIYYIEQIIHFLWNFCLIICKSCYIIENERQVTAMDGISTAIHDSLNGYKAFYGCSNDAAAHSILHSHDWYELYFHYSGGSFYSVNSNIYPLHSGQLMLLPPLCIHGPLFHEENAPYERGYLYLTEKLLKILGCGQIDFVEILQRHTRHGRYQFLMTEEDALRCKTLLQQMDHSASPLNTAEDHARMITVLCMICRLIENPDNDVPPVASPPFIHEILEYVNAHFTQTLSVDEIANMFHLSASHLSHAFVKYTGCSLYDYVLFRRILLAKELLHCDMSLNAIALQCGFNDYSNFLRQFKQREKCSPHVYRKEFCTSDSHSFTPK